MTVVDLLHPGSAVDYAGHLTTPRRAFKTGIPSWDGACDETGGDGLADWWYVVVGGASNAGKTRLALSLYRRACEQLWCPGLISMEVPLHGVQRSMYAVTTSFGFYDLLPRRWAQDAPAKAEKLSADVRRYALEDVDRQMLVVAYDRAPTLDEILASCAELKAAGSRLIILDHLQLIKAPADQIADRATEISEGLRWFAHSEGVLVIALSQLNRFASRERDRRPTMHDLWGGTAIESNANQVLLLDHSKQDRDAVDTHILRTWLYLDKNREGPNRLEMPVLVDFRAGTWTEAEDAEAGRWPQ